MVLELPRQIYEVEPLRCPARGAEMSISVAIMEPKVIDRILAHLRQKGGDPSAGPWRSLAGDASYRCHRHLGGGPGGRTARLRRPVV